MEDAITSAINTYHEFNPTIIDELSDQPSPLEFMRFVARNRPFVVRKGATDWPAFKKWNAQCLRKIMGEEEINVAITPRGNADAVVEQSGDSLCFVEPYEVSEPFTAFLDYVQQDSNTAPKSYQSRNVKYAQTQNDNLRNEYVSLFKDVPPDIPFARLALDQTPDAINLWIGNERSITSLHRDPYENIYVQIAGQKHFTLLPPVELPCVNEQLLPKARYKAVEDSIPLSPDQLAIDVDENEELLPVATWDPDDPDRRTSDYSHLSKPLRVTLDESDMLYLPALWYHKVQQTSGDEGFACAVNYWYDADFSGEFWTANNFLRDVTNASKMSDRSQS